VYALYIFVCVCETCAISSIWGFHFHIEIRHSKSAQAAMVYKASVSSLLVLMADRDGNTTYECILRTVMYVSLRCFCGFQDLVAEKEDDDDSLYDGGSSPPSLPEDFPGLGGSPPPPFK
jgi:hypothetical protein